MFIALVAICGFRWWNVSVCICIRSWKVNDINGILNDCPCVFLIHVAHIHFYWIFTVWWGKTLVLFNDLMMLFFSSDPAIRSVFLLNCKTKIFVRNDTFSAWVIISLFQYQVILLCYTFLTLKHEGWFHLIDEPNNKMQTGFMFGSKCYCGNKIHFTLNALVHWFFFPQENPYCAQHTVRIKR